MSTMSGMSAMSTMSAVLDAAPKEKLPVELAKLVSDDGWNIVIRPLAYVNEIDLERRAAHRAFPIIPGPLCGSQQNLQRGQTKQLLRDRDGRFPGRVENMFKAMVNVISNVVPSHPMDRNLYPFAGVQSTGVADSGGDHAFDAGDCGPASAAAIPIHHPS